MGEIEKNTEINNPLVSITVITYNSAKYVLETLESIKTQTYQNIELIVSDDCSTDNTVDICHKWIDENRDRFVRALLITAKKNTGISSNCNRALYAAKGEWIKSIAGDDLLLSNCVSENVNFVRLNKNICFQFSNLFHINNRGEIITLRDDSNSVFFRWNSNKQHRRLINHNWISAPTSFIRTEVLKEIGGFDEDIKFMEDYPLWIKATKFGYKLYHMPIVTVKYRLHNESISHKHTNDKLRDNKIMLYKYKLSDFKIQNGLYVWHEYLELLSNSNNIAIYFSPLYLFRKIKNSLLKRKSVC